MDEKARAFLFDLLDTPSPSGFEARGQRKWADYVRAWADRVESDVYGSVWATLEGLGADGAPRLLLEAHADEIGFMVSHVGDDGFLRLRPIGGSDRALARGRRVRILGSRGPVPGVIGNTAIHLREKKEDEKVADWHELFVDVGAASAGEVAERGIRVGHPAVFDASVEELMPGRLVGRALDNRIGGFIIARVLARLAEAPVRPAATVYALNAVQEEIGGHGAQMAAYRLQPTLALVFDVTHATDSPGIDEARHGKVTLGGGPAVTHGSSNHPRVVERLLEVAEHEGIAVQHEAASRSTGTDTDTIFTTHSGVPSALVSLPMRYMHSTVEMVDLADVERCIDLLTAFAEAVRKQDVFRVEI